MGVIAQKGESIRSTESGFEWKHSFNFISYEHYFEKNLLKETASFYEKKVIEW
jgi:hypothetical protein